MQIKIAIWNRSDAFRLFQPLSDCFPDPCQTRACRRGHAYRIVEGRYRCSGVQASWTATCSCSVRSWARLEPNARARSGDAVVRERARRCGGLSVPGEPGSCAAFSPCPTKCQGTHCCDTGTSLRIPKPAGTPSSMQPRGASASLSRYEQGHRFTEGVSVHKWHLLAPSLCF